MKKDKPNLKIIKNPNSDKIIFYGKAQYIKERDLYRSLFHFSVLFNIVLVTLCVLLGVTK